VSPVEAPAASMVTDAVRSQLYEGTYVADAQRAGSLTQTFAFSLRKR